MSEKITALIVDDERFSREELSFLLEGFESIQVIGEADSGESAVMKTIQLQPDVLFLDVEMPKMNGLEVAKAVRELKKVPRIIFATAYPDFAVDAFRHEALDYLLKPYEEEQVAEAVHRLMKYFDHSKQTIVSAPSPSKLAIEGEDEIIYLEPEDIYYVFRDDRITKIVGEKREYETKLPLKDVEQRLAGYSFFRIHKSYLVNLDYVDRLIPWFNGAYQLQVKGKHEQLSVSRNYVKTLRKRLEL
ncbi:LytR/AlgR family response regulator transcription factor [Thalassobacillus hwangdonensis]|uniref:LytR/AlgR family response regulator transcription factor n=1 Tax=Thalassobacillus hwangdonensis TaxID=546108 RepID=A0ABW3L1K8_9BACI